jgi:hypothetical protein
MSPFDALVKAHLACTDVKDGWESFQAALVNEGQRSSWLRAWGELPNPCQLTISQIKGQVHKLLVQLLGNDPTAALTYSQGIDALESHNVDLAPLYSAFAMATNTLVVISLGHYDVVVHPEDGVDMCNEGFLLVKTQLDCKHEWPGTGLRFFFHPLDFKLTIARAWSNSTDDRVDFKVDRVRSRPGWGWYIEQMRPLLEDSAWKNNAQCTRTEFYQILQEAPPYYYRHLWWCVTTVATEFFSSECKDIIVSYLAPHAYLCELALRPQVDLTFVLPSEPRWDDDDSDAYPSERASLQPDGKCIVSGSADHSVRLWYTRNGVSLNECKGHTGSVNSVVIHFQACFAFSRQFSQDMMVTSH